MRPTNLLIPALLVTLGAASGAQAADWTHTITPYMWGAGMDGKSAIGPVEADVDLSFGDIWDNLDIGGMMSYRGERDDRLVVMLDAIYMNLSADKTHAEGPVQVYAEAGIQQTAIEGDVGYRLTDHVITYAGLRYNDINADLKVVRTGPGPGETRTPGTNESWVDPIIGAIGEYPLSDTWTVALRGDMGGFGMGSDFAWQGTGSVTWQASELVSVVGGYRYIHMDYDNGSGLGYFKYDMGMSGPFLGVGFTF